MASLPTRGQSAPTGKPTGNLRFPLGFTYHGCPLFSAYLKLAKAGYQVCKTLRREPRHRRRPIIMLTARTDEDDVSTGLDLGADDYITKPFSPKILLFRIKSVLRRSREENGPAGEEGGCCVSMTWPSIPAATR